MKILIVEDDEIMSRMYKRLFVHEGYHVDIAENGEEGMQKALTEKPDLILLDVMLPKLNGLELLDRLKATDQTRSIAVVMLTNLGIQKEIEKAISNGAIKYIIKSNNDPYAVFNEVKKILESILHRESGTKNKNNSQ